MREIKFRCSSLGRLMTEPKSKSEVLSVGAKTHIRELAAEEILGVEFEVSDKKMEKGTRVEAEAIALVGRVRGLQLVKNTERRSNEWISGEADIAQGRDIKAAWSAATYPICWEDVAEAQRKTYEWQMRGYMWLWDREEWHIDHVLVDTPEDLIGYEPLTLHVVSHIPEYLRVTTWTVRRDRAIEQLIAEKVEHARQYYAEVLAEFDRTHQPPARADDSPPWNEAPAQPAPAKRPETTAADLAAIDF